MKINRHKQLDRLRMLIHKYDKHFNLNVNIIKNNNVGDELIEYLDKNIKHYE